MVEPGKAQEALAVVTHELCVPAEVDISALVREGDDEALVAPRPRGRKIDPELELLPFRGAHRGVEHGKGALGDEGSDTARAYVPLAQGRTEPLT